MTPKSRRAEYLALTSWVCPICKMPIWSQDPAQNHHAGEHDTEGANDRNPLFTQSLLNLVRCHAKCHEKNPGFGRVPAWVADGWENIFQVFKALVRGGADIDMVRFVKELEFIKAETKTRGRI